MPHRRSKPKVVLVHALVIGEIACGAFARRSEALALLRRQPWAACTRARADGAGAPQSSNSAFAISTSSRSIASIGVQAAASA